MYIHSSMSFGFAPLAFPRPFRNRIRLSIWYLLAVQYAVTRGSFSRSAFPSLAASRLAVGSLIRVYLLGHQHNFRLYTSMFAHCEYTSLPLSSSSSPTSGFGRSFSFCTVFVVLCGPILPVGNAGYDSCGAP